jgi:hypothetical protein
LARLGQSGQYNTNDFSQNPERGRLARWGARKMFTLREVMVEFKMRDGFFQLVGAQCVSYGPAAAGLIADRSRIQENKVLSPCLSRGCEASWKLMLDKSRLM